MTTLCSFAGSARSSFWRRKVLGKVTALVSEEGKVMGSRLHEYAG